MSGLHLQYECEQDGLQSLEVTEYGIVEMIHVKVNGDTSELLTDILSPIDIIAALLRPS
jgi:hypothetical protein